jgi:octaprenyl-diphosphate synthase
MPISLDVTRFIKSFDSKLEDIIHEDLPILRDIKKYVIKSGGKRIRPLTHVFIAQLLGYKGKLWQDVGAIAELIHSASLLHDDVVDGAELRRGEPTVGKIYGNKSAILSGDYLLASGIEHLNKLQNPKLMDSFTRVIRDLAVGELLQMEWEKNPKITTNIYDKIIFGKTASLFGAVTETAGILAEVSIIKIKELHTFGVTMGSLFQKKDDFIDYFESADKSGKVALKDFSNGLYTYPVILLMQKVNKTEQKEVISLLSKDEKGKTEKDRILALMNNYKIQKEFSDSLKKDALFLNSFLAQFPDTKIRKLMMERIEGIVKG